MGKPLEGPSISGGNVVTKTRLFLLAFTLGYASLNYQILAISHFLMWSYVHIKKGKGQMAEMKMMSESQFAGVPITIWIAGAVAFLCLVAAFVIIRSAKFRLGWKSKKREFTLEISNKKTDSG